MVCVDQTLDARHLMCPMPVIRTQQTVADMQDGQVLKVLCTDPSALIDIPAWCRIHGHQVLCTQSQSNGATVHLQVHHASAQAPNLQQAPAG